MPTAVAVAVSVPEAVGVTLIEAEAMPPLVRLPKRQITVLLVVLTDPCEELIERMVTPPGSALVTVTPVAALGPLFVTDTL